MAFILSTTSADLTMTLTVQGLYNAPQQIVGFGVDDAFSTEDVAQAETEIGVDGYMAAGFVFVKYPMKLMLLAGSPSGFLFDNWIAAERSPPVSTLVANGTITLPSLGYNYTLTNGVLTGYRAIPDAKKTLASRPFTITWQSITPVPTS